MCNNIVVFTGDPAALENVKALFKEIQDRQETTGQWYLPPYVTAESSHMLNIAIDQNTINYDTRWLPNLQGLIQIADHYKLDFVSYYNELADWVFGEATYTKGNLLDICLDPADFQTYRFDPGTRLFSYNGQTFENETPVFEAMLEEKKANNPYFKTTSDIAKEQLVQLYGDLLPGDLVLKFAEHKNFDKARETFQEMDEAAIIEIDNFLIANHFHGQEHYKTQEEFLTIAFLKQLVSEWNTKRSGTLYQTGQSL